jgi:hypothetical protein
MKTSTTQTAGSKDVLAAAKAFFVSQMTIGADMERARAYATEEYLPKADGQAGEVTKLIEAWRYPYNTEARIAELVRLKTDELVAEQATVLDATHTAINRAWGIVCKDVRLSAEERGALHRQLNGIRPEKNEEQYRHILAKAAKRGKDGLYRAAGQSIEEVMGESRLDSTRRSQIVTFIEAQVVLHLTEMGSTDAKAEAEAMLARIDAVLHPADSKPRVMANTGRSVSTEPKPKRILRPRGSEPKPKPLPLIQVAAVKHSLAGKPKEEVLKVAGQYLTAYADRLAPDAKGAIVDEVRLAFFANEGSEADATAWLDSLVEADEKPQQCDDRQPKAEQPRNEHPLIKSAAIEHTLRNVTDPSEVQKTLEFYRDEMGEYLTEDAKGYVGMRLEELRTGEAPKAEPKPEQPAKATPKREKQPRRKGRKEGSDEDGVHLTVEAVAQEETPKINVVNLTERPDDVDPKLWSLAVQIAGTQFDPRDCLLEAERRLNDPDAYATQRAMEASTV